MSKIRKNIPKEIYLQISDDCDTDDFLKETKIVGDEGEVGITWCEDKINDNDIRYVLDKRHISKNRDKKKEYLADIIYSATQYLSLPDKEVVILNNLLFKAISKRLGQSLEWRRKDEILDILYNCIKGSKVWEMLNGKVDLIPIANAIAKRLGVK